jgi:hypothetical protein
LVWLIWSYSGLFMPILNLHSAFGGLTILCQRFNLCFLWNSLLVCIFKWFLAPFYVRFIDARHQSLVRVIGRLLHVD